MTIATVLVVLTSVSAHVAPTAVPATPHDPERAHRVMFVSPVARPRVVRSAPEAKPRARVSPRARPGPATGDPMTAPQPERVAPDSSAGAQASPNAARSAVSEFESRWTAHGVSPLLLPSTPADPGSAGGTSSGPTVRIPNMAVDRDAQIRAQEMADRAAQAAGAPMPTSGQRGISIDAPIPFGGPSNAQRKRDSTINAQTKAVLARVRQRLDSIAAARRRHADSVAALEKRP